MNTHKKNTSPHLYIGLLIIVIILVLYYLFNQNYNSGTLEIQSSAEGAVVFINNEERGTIKDEPFVLKGLKSGNYTVIVSKDGYWPWSKSVTIQSGKTALTPFIFQAQPEYEIIEKSNTDYSRIVNLISQSTTPTTTTKRWSHNENVSLWIEGTTLKAEWIGDNDSIGSQFCTEESATSPRECIDTVDVLRAASPIRNAHFLQSREDVVLFAIDTSIYAIEIKPSGSQNFQPVYTGIKPEFTIDDENILIKDGADILTIAFE